jgi:hypothetical protein
MVQDQQLKNPNHKQRGIRETRCKVPQGRHPRMFLSGVQFRTRLDSRLKHAGMTDFGKEIRFFAASCGESTHSD